MDTAKHKKNICIAGYGYVGRAFYHFFSLYNHFNVFAYDINPSLASINPLVSTDDELLNTADLVVICVSTPPSEDGSVNTSYVEDVLSRIRKETTVLIKSTIPPGTTDSYCRKFPKLKVAFSPEYIGESSYYLPTPYDFDKDVIKTPFFIFGGEKQICNEIVGYYTQIAGPCKEYVFTTALNAELCKYMENTYFATKIVFCNEYRRICESFGADYNEVRELWLKDPRVLRTHTMIYNTEEPYCFGGKCLPKDLSGIIEQSSKVGYSAPFLKSVQQCNTRLRTHANENILMIHHVHINSEQNISPLSYDRGMVISCYALDAIIKDFLDRGYQFGNLEECVKEPDKFFCLTFDDGFKEHLLVAKELQAAYSPKKSSMIFSISTGNISGKTYSGMEFIYRIIDSGYGQELKGLLGLFENSSIKEIKAKYGQLDPEALRLVSEKFINRVNMGGIFLSAQEIKELSNYGLIASHGVSHRDLTTNVETSLSEIADSKRDLEEIIQESVSAFCFPEGRYNDALLNCCKKAGYSMTLGINSIEKNYCVGRKQI